MIASPTRAARLGVAVDVAAVEQRAQDAPAPRLAGAGAASRRRSACRPWHVRSLRLRSHRVGHAAGQRSDRRAFRSWRRSDRRCRAAPARAAARAGGRACRIASASIGFSVQMALRQLLDARRDDRACSIRRAAPRSRRCSRRISPRSLATRSACTRRFEFDLVDIGRREHERARSRRY